MGLKTIQLEHQISLEVLETSKGCLVLNKGHVFPGHNKMGVEYWGGGLETWRDRTRWVKKSLVGDGKIFYFIFFLVVAINLSGNKHLKSALF